MLQFQHERFRKQLIKEGIDKYLKIPGKKVITPEDIQKISSYVAEKYTYGTMPMNSSITLEANQEFIDELLGEAQSDEE